MAFSRYFFFVEGADDQTFVDRVLSPRLQSIGFDHVDTIQWSQLRKEKRRGLIESVTSMGAAYTVLIDQDGLCITQRKERYTTKHPFVDPLRVIVACPEIEAWYAAGAPSKMDSLRVAMQDVSCITKEVFRTLAPQIAPDEQLAKLALLDEYDLASAQMRSASLAYLFRKFPVGPPT